MMKREQNLTSWTRQTVLDKLAAIFDNKRAKALSDGWILNFSRDFCFYDTR